MKYFLGLLLFSSQSLATPKFRFHDIVILTKDFKFSDYELFKKCDEVTEWDVVGYNEDPGFAKYAIQPRGPTCQDGFWVTANYLRKAEK